LRALAIREKKIHVVGRVNVSMNDTLVLFDVESAPDRDFYYLIGVRVGIDENSTTHSFWADSSPNERTIWTDFLAVLSTLQKPLLVHYGNLETKFLKKMCIRYGSPPEGSAAAEAIASALNILSLMFARVYFPSYSNGLKENARFLNFTWSDPTADGLQAIVWRCLWEDSRDPALREKLITYNREDCAALAVVTRTLGRLSDEASDDQTRPHDIEIVRTETIKPLVSKWRPFKSPIADLEEINSFARWDYQRDRVFVRSGIARGGYRGNHRRYYTSKEFKSSSFSTLGELARNVRKHDAGRGGCSQEQCMTSYLAGTASSEGLSGMLPKPTFA
jgi:hypothetical protein